MNNIFEEILKVYMSNDICMSELLRNEEFKNISRDIKMRLLKISGDHLYVTVNENNEIVLLG